MQMCVELRNKTVLWVSEEQAKVVDQAWVAKSPVKINGAKISTADIVGIWPDEIWYDNHPEDRPKSEPLPQLAPITFDSKPDTPYSRAWYEALRRNKELLVKGQKPKWIVEDNQIVEKEGFWINHPRPMEGGVLYTWVKKTVSPTVYAKRYSSPGYYRIGNEFDNIVVGFRVAGVPAHLTECDPSEREQLERRIA